MSLFDRLVDQVLRDRMALNPLRGAARAEGFVLQPSRME